MAVIYMHIHTPPPPIPGILPSVQAVLDRALAKNPNERYETSREMAIEFFRSIGMTAEAKTISEPYPGSFSPASIATPVQREPAPKPGPTRSRAWLRAGIFSFVCLLAVGAGAWGLSSYLPSFSRAAEAAPTAAATDPTATVSVPITGDLPSQEGMVEVQGGTYEVGLSPADQYHVTQTTLQLKNFWIDQYQISNARYQAYIDETNSPPPEVWPGEGDHPVRGVTWDQALAYCTWAKKRLPTEGEWEVAGRGPGAAPRLYPWGNDPTADGQALRLPDQDTYAIGTQSFNKSPFGVFDMVGNIWEWVGDPYAAGQQGSKILRGGRYGLPVLDLAYRLAIPPGDTRYVRYAGFRCAADQVQ